LEIVRSKDPGSVHDSPPREAVWPLIAFRQEDKITKHHAEKKPNPGNKKVARSFHTSLMLPMFALRKPNPRR